MKRKCCVPTCNSFWKCTVCRVGLSYFKAPKESTLARKWELALGLKDSSLLSRDRVCSSHFRKIDIVTKRFVSMKHPSTNSKMILEISKLERDAVPTKFHHETKQCSHNKSVRLDDKQVSSGMMKSSRSEGSSSVTSPPASSQSDDDSDESSRAENDDEKRRSSRPTRRDYRLLARSVERRSRRRQIRAFTNLCRKWQEKARELEHQTRLLENKIHELEIEEIEAFNSG